MKTPVITTLPKIRRPLIPIKAKLVLIGAMYGASLTIGTLGTIAAIKASREA